MISILHMAPQNRCFKVGVLCAAVWVAEQAHAADSAHTKAALPIVQEVTASQQTRIFGDMSLSLSLKLSRLPADRAPEDVANAQALKDVNSRIAALEREIDARQKLIEKSGAAPSGQIPMAVPTPVRTGPVADAVVPAQPKPKPRVVMEDGGMMPLVAGAVMLFLVVALLLYRRRKSIQTSRHAAGAQDAEASGVTSAVPELEPQEVKTLVLGASPLAAQHQAPAHKAAQPMQSLLPPEFEMLEEADIYLRFGHDKLAEEALREAIRINPKNPQPYLTLLRVYFSREDKAAFFALAQQLKSMGDQGAWPRVVEMGRSLEPDNSLYQ